MMPSQKRSLFSAEHNKPIIGCIHLKALPGSPLYDGNQSTIYEQALTEAKQYQDNGAHALIIENFGDTPFYPGNVPSQTIASMAAIGREIRLHTTVPIGINVLRNDAQAALSIAHAIDAQFIRINIHMHAFVTDQGIIQGVAHETLRLRKSLSSEIEIWSDILVKHAIRLGNATIAQDALELCERGLSDVLIVSGIGTGKPTNKQDLALVKQACSVPVVIGSGITLENMADYYRLCDGFIIGSYFKEKGISQNKVDPQRVAKLVSFTAGLVK
jgi:membrane complex biogenesis BtpA family protein